MSILSGITIAVGLGSPHGDDQVGWQVVDRLAARGDFMVCKARDGVELLQAIEGHDHVLVIDAAVPSGDPGRLLRFEWPDGDLLGANLVSTHGLGLVEALRMSRALGRAPRHVTIVTIEAKEIRPFSSLSEDVERAVDRLIGALGDGLDEVATFPGPCLSN